MEIENRVKKAFQCNGWFDTDTLLWALINEDKDAIARFRIQRRKLDAKEKAIRDQLAKAKDEAEQHAILAAIKAPMDAKEVTKEELEAERAAMRLLP